MKLWGKTMAELDEDHRRMLAEREERGMSPGQLGKMYADQINSVQRQCYFGTDIPIPERNTDSTGQYVIPRRPHPSRGKWPVLVLGIAAWALTILIGLAIVHALVGLL